MRSLTLSIGLLAVLCACAGTETDNPVVDFDKSGCKSHGLALSLDPGVARTRAMLDVEDSIYDGLYCYAWEATASGALTLDVINYSGGCSVDWAFDSAELDGDLLRVAVINDRCSVAACGSCIYDFSFDLTDIDTSKPLDVELREEPCDDDWEVDVEPVVRLPLDEQSEGVRCRYLGPTGFEERCGEPYFPQCGTLGQGQVACDQGAAEPCGDGLVCVDGVGYSGTCLTFCESDGDCPLEVESCQDGACRPRDPF